MLLMKPPEEDDTREEVEENLLFEGRGVFELPDTDDGYPPPNDGIDDGMDVCPAAPTAARGGREVPGGGLTPTG